VLSGQARRLRRSLPSGIA